MYPPRRETKRCCPECGAKLHSDVALVAHLQKEHGYGQGDAWEIVRMEREKKL